MKIYYFILFLGLLPIISFSQNVLVSAGVGYGGYNQTLAFDQTDIAAQGCNAVVTKIPVMPMAPDIVGKDVLFVFAPDDFFNAAAKTEISNLLSGGGVVFLVGEHAGFTQYNDRIDDLLAFLGSTMSNVNNFANSQCNVPPINVEPNNSCIMQGISFWQTQALSALNPGLGTVLLTSSMGEAVFVEEAVGGGLIYYISDVNWLDPPSCDNDAAVVLIENMICGCVDACNSTAIAIVDTFEFCQGDTSFVLEIDTSSDDPSATVLWTATNGGEVYLDDVTAEDPVLTIPESFTGEIWYTVLVDGDTTGCDAMDSILVIVHPNPIPEITGDNEVCINGMSYSLQGSPLGGTWNGVGMMGEVDPDVLGLGEHTVIYRVTENGCTMRDTFTVEVHDTTTILIAPLADSFCITGGLIPLTTIPTGGIWDMPVIGTTVDPLLAGPGVHDLRYEYTNSDGCVTESSVRIEILDLAVSQILGPDELCIGQNASLYIGVFPGGVWGGVADANGIVDPNGLFAGIHMITYSSPPSLCNIPDTLWINIYEAPEATVVDSLYICATGENTSINFFEQILSGDFGGEWIDLNQSGASDSFPELDFSGVESGIYSFLYRTTSAEGPCANAQDILIVEVPPKVAFIDYEVIPLSCESHTDAMINIVEVRNGIGPFEYSLNGSVLQSEAEFDFLEPGSYELMVIDSFGCPFWTTLDIPSRPDLSVELGVSVVLEEGEELFTDPIINLPDSLISDLYWTVLEDTICFQCPALSFVPDSGGILVLTVTDIFGCMARDSVKYVIEPNEKVYVATVFSPNGDNVNDVLYVQGDPKKISEIEFFYIYDRWGSLMFSAEHFKVNDETYGWDGRFGGRQLNASVYAYHMQVRYVSGAVQEIKSDFTLIR